MLPEPPDEPPDDEPPEDEPPDGRRLRWPDEPPDEPPPDELDEDRAVGSGSFVGAGASVTVIAAVVASGR